MKSKIEIESNTCNIESTYSPIDIYHSLRTKYKEEEIIILESMSGPERDCTQSIVGFKPIINILVKNRKVIITGNELLVKKILNHEAIQSYSVENQQIEIISNSDVISIFRSIESIFSINYLGLATDVAVGFFGYFGYDSIFFFEDIEQKISRNKNFSDINLTLYQNIINVNLRENKTTLTINNSKDDLFSTSNQDEIINLITKLHATEHDHNYNYHSIASVQKDLYFKWFEKAKGHINIGDIYQIQLGHEITIESNIPPFQVYLRLRKYNPSPYMYFFKTSEGVYIIGASPEMFVTLTRYNDVIMRPIAGTIRNSSDPIIKESNRKKLLSDEKEKAEHLMLVDLCRNDIARICIPSSLKVNDLIVTEEYSHVIHLVSDISAKLQSGLDKYDVIGASFPAGTMTGTPKIRAIEIIEDTEISERGIYAGCIGFLGFNNILISALCIRTAVYHNGIYSIRASGGIVEDSTNEGEWNETISKLSSTYFAITNKELASENFIN